jgi:aspartate carbamoyltransferase catalytic subunit
MKLRSRHLLGIESLDAEEITLILDTANSFLEVSGREIKKVPVLRGRTVVNFFVEASTRTRTSFEVAEKRLSADTLNISASQSSLVKGETLVDTALNLEAMNPDFIVMRHAEPGAHHLIARFCRASVVNAGDGRHGHPTQALLDAMTMRQKFGRLDGLNVTILGDVKHSRVARSNIQLLNTMGSKVRICGPPTLIPPRMESLGCEVSYCPEEAIVGADVVMVLRMQLERMQGGYVPSLREYAQLYQLTEERLALASDRAIVMHPGPMNRGVEIDSRVANGRRSVILEQVANGVAVRMSVLYLLAGGEREDAAATAS